MRIVSAVAAAAATEKGERTFEGLGYFDICWGGFFWSAFVFLVISVLGFVFFL